VEAPKPIPVWGALALSVLAMAMLYVSVSIAASLRAAAHGHGMEHAAEQVASDPLNLGAIQAFAFGSAIVAGLLFWQRGVRARDALTLRPVSMATLGLAAIAGLALQFPLAEIANLVQELVPVSMEEQLRQQRLVTPDSPFDAIATIVAVVVVAAGSEELFFRGLLLPRLREAHGTTIALVVTSLLFGLVHGHPVAIAYATVAGLVLGAVAIRTGSTLPALVMHASVNAVPLLLPERVVAIPGFNMLGPDVYHLPLPILVGAGVVAAAALATMAKLSEGTT
jgi:hypothetical protein